MLRIADALDKYSIFANEPGFQALALLIRANGDTFGSAAYAKAISRYDQAAAIYQELDDPILQANAQIGKVFALANREIYRSHRNRQQRGEDVLRNINNESFDLPDLR